MAKTKKQTKQKEPEKQYKYIIKDGEVERVLIIDGDASYDAFFNCYGEALVELDDGTREFWQRKVYDSYEEALGYLMFGLKDDLEYLKDSVRSYQMKALAFLTVTAFVITAVAFVKALNIL